MGAADSCSWRHSCASQHPPPPCSLPFLHPPAPHAQPAVQTLGAVQTAGVQTVTTDVCSQLASLVLNALRAGDITTASRLISTVYIQGGCSGCWVLGAEGAGGRQPGLTHMPARSPLPSFHPTHLHHPDCQARARVPSLTRSTAPPPSWAAPSWCPPWPPPTSWPRPQVRAAAAACGADGLVVGAGRLGSCARASTSPPPKLTTLPTRLPPRLHTSAGAEAAFVATLSARPALLATLRGCLTPQQVLAGATQALTPAAPAAQVREGGWCGGGG